MKHSHSTARLLRHVEIVMTSSDRQRLHHSAISIFQTLKLALHSLGFCSWGYVNDEPGDIGQAFLVVLKTLVRKTSCVGLESSADASPR